jgi:hypothetical protein
LTSRRSRLSYGPVRRTGLQRFAPFRRRPRSPRRSRRAARRRARSARRSTTRSRP